MKALENNPVSFEHTAKAKKPNHSLREREKEKGLIRVFLIFIQPFWLPWHKEKKEMKRHVEGNKSTISKILFT